MVHIYIYISSEPDSDSCAYLFFVEAVPLAIEEAETMDLSQPATFSSKI